MGTDYDQNPSEGQIDRMPPVEQELVRALRDQPLEYVNLAYEENPLVKDLPDNVKAFIKAAQRELEDLLQKEEVRKLTFNSLEIRAKVKALQTGVPTSTN